jgi:hypothetical protein
MKDAQQTKAQWWPINSRAHHGTIPPENPTSAAQDRIAQLPPETASSSLASLARIAQRRNLRPRPRDGGRHAASSAPCLVQRTACYCCRLSPLHALAGRCCLLCCFVVAVDRRPQVQRRPGGPLLCHCRPVTPTAHTDTRSHRQAPVATAMLLDCFC